MIVKVSSIYDNNDNQWSYSNSRSSNIDVIWYHTCSNILRIKHVGHIPSSIEHVVSI
jgi:hypothetical protein